MWIVPSTLFRPMPWRMAATNSAIRSPACSPTIVAPRIASVPGFDDHLHEAVRLAVGDRPVEVVDAVGRSPRSAMPFSFASVSFSPTRATSGSVNVAQGITE